MGRTTDTRERLLETTLALVRRDGYGAVTVDAICEKAGVKKGSFYYFFPSKDELVVAALDAHWERLRGELDRIFSPTRPPIDRLVGYFEFVHRRQKELRAELGHTVGCPLFSVGSEVSAHNPVIVAKVQELVGRVLKYFESALRDLHAEGQLPGTDFAVRARRIHAYTQGILAEARIQDDVSLTRGIQEGAFRLIGLRVPPQATVPPSPSRPRRPHARP